MENKIEGYIIRDVRYYPWALSHEEVLAIYNQTEEAETEETETDE